MTAKQFVDCCYREKEQTVKEYFNRESQSLVGNDIKLLIDNGADRDVLYRVIDNVLSENYYRLLLALDGEASLGGVQMMYKIYDEDNNLLNECGEIETAAYECFIEKSLA